MVVKKILIINFIKTNFVIEPETNLQEFLNEKIIQKKFIKIAPINMSSFFLMFFSPYQKKKYQKMDLVYPESQFACWCFSLFNKNNHKKKKIYSFRLLLNLIGKIFHEHYPVTFLGLDNNQKTNLDKKLKSWFTNISDICFINREMSIYQPEETVKLLNRSHYGLVIVDHKISKLYPIILDKVKNGLLFFDSYHLTRYEKKWNYKQNSRWKPISILQSTGKELWKFIKIVFGTLVLFYPSVAIFSISFLIFVFLVNKTSRKKPIIFNSL